MHPLHYFLSNIEKTNYFPITTFLPPMIYMPRFSDDISIDVSPTFLPVTSYMADGADGRSTDTPVTDVAPDQSISFRIAAFSTWQLVASDGS